LPRLKTLRHYSDPSKIIQHSGIHTASECAMPPRANEIFRTSKTFSFHFGKVRVEYPLCASSLLNKICSPSFRGAEGDGKSLMRSIFRARFLAWMGMTDVETFFSNLLD